MKDIDQNEPPSEEERVESEPQHVTRDDAHPRPDSGPVETTVPADNYTLIPLISEPPKPDTMEVHHHGHVHEQKKWKEYVFQFFMLFFAVFCGFLAEYQLEQTIERHREKEYIASFINDLKLDTAQIKLRSRNIANASKGIDSLLAMSKDLSHRENVRFLCYYYIRYVPTTILLVANDGTMQQLKNSGGLRLIKNKSAVDSILLYDSYSKGVASQGERYRDNVIKALDASDHIFDWTTFDGVDPKSLLTSESVSLANPTKEELQYFINRIIKQKGVSNIYQRYLEDQFQRASRILPFLQKQYNL
jgi:hypothetical protein